MKKEAALKFRPKHGSRSLDVERYGDEVHFEIDAPWAGSTRSGFGQSLDFTLNPEEAQQLGQWLLDQFPK